MDFDSFLTSPRWEILQIIAEKPSSPVEIAEKLNTTVSYASQQLKLLDAASLLIKEKTGAAGKGKPRTLFSLSNELVYISILTKEFSDKKLIYLTGSHKVILKIWMVSDISKHYYIEKIYWKLEEDLEEISAIFIEDSSKVKIIIVSDSKKINAKVKSLSDKFKEKIEIQIMSKEQSKKLLSDYLIALYDPQDILKNLKGGNFGKDE